MDSMPDCCYDYRYEAPTEKIVDTCMDCGELIYEGEEYYDIRGMIICSKCMNEYKREAELD